MFGISVLVGNLGKQPGLRPEPRFGGWRQKQRPEPRLGGRRQELRTKHRLGGRGGRAAVGKGIGSVEGGRGRRPPVDVQGRLVA